MIADIQNFAIKKELPEDKMPDDAQIVLHNGNKIHIGYASGGIHLRIEHKNEKENMSPEEKLLYEIFGGNSKKVFLDFNAADLLVKYLDDWLYWKIKKNS
jgi:hypothetical protein